MLLRWRTGGHLEGRTLQDWHDLLWSSTYNFSKVYGAFRVHWVPIKQWEELPSPFLLADVVSTEPKLVFLVAPYAAQCSWCQRIETRDEGLISPSDIYNKYLPPVMSCTDGCVAVTAIISIYLLQVVALSIRGAPATLGI